MPRQPGGRPHPPLLVASAVLHGAGAAILAWSPESAPQVASALVANHVVIGAAGMMPRSRLLGPNLSRLPGDGTERIVALTFDDGPDAEGTPRVLDLLDAAGQRATFFCIGRHVERHAAIARAIVERGHGIENHTHSHPNTFAFRGPAGIAEEIERAQQAIEQTTGHRPRYFRAPVGIQNPFVRAVLDRADLSLVSWTRRGLDTVTKDADKVAARLIGNGIESGDILLLHDRMRVAAGALPRVLDEIKRRDLTSVSLPDTR